MKKNLEWRIAFAIAIFIAIWQCIIFTVEIVDTLPYAEVKVKYTSNSSRPSRGDSLDYYFDVLKKPYYVSQEPVMTFRNNPLVSLFSKNEMFENPLSILCLFTICVYFILRFKKIEVNKPFSSEFVKSIRAISIIFILFGLADYIRIFLLDRYILNVSNGEFTVPNFSFANTLFLIGILFTVIHGIYKQGEKLQKEQELVI